MTPRSRFLFAAAIITSVVAAGCSKAPEAAADPGQPHRHHHRPPHGGTPVALGADEYLVELVLDDATGKLQAFVLDDDMENFVRSSAPSFTIEATGGGSPREVVLAAVPNTETGETVGDTALFEGQAGWLEATPRFDGVLKSITVRGTTFTDVKFGFPKGNDAGD
jgi:hypothetical protein